MDVRSVCTSIPRRKILCIFLALMASIAIIALFTIKLSPVTGSTEDTEGTRIYFEGPREYDADMDGIYTFTTNEIGLGERFNATVKVSNVTDMAAWQVNMTFRDTLLNVSKVYLHPDQPVEGLNLIDQGRCGKADYSYVTFGVVPPVKSPPGYNGSYRLCNFEFGVIKVPRNGYVEDHLKIDTTFKGENATLLLDTSGDLISCTRISGYYKNRSPIIISVFSPRNGSRYPASSLPLNLNYSVSAVEGDISWTGHSLDGENITDYDATMDGKRRVTITRTLTNVSSSNHTLMIYANDTDGNTGLSKPIYFTIFEPPTARFSYSPEFPVADETLVTFNASESYDSDGYITSYWWAFGDGSSLKETDPITNHTFTGYGNLTVRLNVTDNDNSISSTTKTVQVRSRPFATFEWSPESPIVGEIVTFDASKSVDRNGKIVSYYWDFGDGKTTTVKKPITTRIYGEGGNYNVTLIVSDNENLTARRLDRLVVKGYPVANFTYMPKQPDVGDTLTFNASLSAPNGGTILSYWWDFGDGSSPVNETDPIINHTYITVGNYTVTLVVTDSEGLSDRTTATIICGRSPEAIFTFSPGFPIAGETVTFNASSSFDSDGNITRYTWDFGDGHTISTNTSITTYVYTMEGNYTVTLTVTDNDGFDSSTQDTVRLRNHPTASFVYSPEPAVVNKTVTFDASSSTANGGSIITYTWRFGDGNVTTVNTPTVTHIYSRIGNYTVTLTALDSENLNNSKSEEIHVGQPPKASFNYSPDSPYMGDPITFNASDSYDPNGNIVVYWWDFGDGSAVNKTDPVATHTYSTSGNHTVSLTVLDNEGLSGTYQRSVTVQQAPVASFKYSSDYPIAGETVTFNASDSYDPNGEIANYTWDFGDGNVATITVPVINHVYFAYGNYTVALAVTDDNGYMDTATEKLKVRDYPLADFAFSPSYPTVNETVIFDASSSAPNGGKIVSYYWDFGDGYTERVLSNFSITHVYTAPGNYTVVLTVRDNETLEDTISKTIEIGAAPDTTPPKVEVLSPKNKTYFVSSVNLTFTVSESTSWMGYSLDGEANETITANVTLKNLLDKPHFVTVFANDTAGNVGWDTVYFTVNAEPPVITFLSPENKTYNTKNIPLTFKVDWTGNVADWMGYSLNDQANLTVGGNTTLSGLSDGSHWVVVYANDTAGNMGSSNRVYFVVDTVPPAIEVLSPENKTYSITSIDLVFTVKETTSWIGYSLDGLPNSTVTGNITLTSLLEGPHRIRVYANDTAGNMGLTNITHFTVFLRDVALDYVTLPSSKQVDQGEIVGIIILVGNRGVKTEIFNVTVSYDLGVIGTCTVQLEADSKMFLPFQWDTTNIALGSYTINATAITCPHPEEKNKENNIFLHSRKIKVTIYPTAHFTYSPEKVWVNRTVWFDANMSIANYGSLTGYFWDFGDNSTVSSTNPLVSHVYASEGTYKVILTVENTLNNTRNYVMNVTVQACAPLVPPSWNVLAAMAVGVAMIGVAMFISVRYTRRITSSIQRKRLL